jgi:hypothetical protein
MIYVDPFVPWLKGVGSNFTSQFGEDGLIEAALARYGEGGRRCFEVGAADGVWLSNTKRLRDQGWSAILIEGDPKSYASLADNAARERDSRCVNAVVTADNLDDVLGSDPIDFGVIDIDGQDYWAWEGLRQVRPRLILIEFACRSREEPEAFDWIPVRGSNGPEQAGYGAIMALGKTKGYLPLAATGVNLLFVDETEEQRCGFDS